MGKIFKFKINEFSIGFGPAIYKKKKKNGEIFALRAFPLGGYCAFEGEDGENSDPNAFNNKKPWQRILVLVSGAAMNFILALIVIMMMIGFYGMTVFQAVEIMPQTENEQIFETKSLQSGDLIASITSDGKKTDIFMSTDFVTALNHKSKYDIVYCGVIRDGVKLSEPVEVALRSNVECKNLTEITSCYDALGIGTIPLIQSNNSTDESILMNGDYLLRFNDGAEYEDGIRIYTVNDLYNRVKTMNVGDTFSFYVSRNAERQLLNIKLDGKWETVNKDNKDAVILYLGINAYDYVYNTSGKEVNFGFFDTIGRSFEYSFVIGGTIFRTLGQLLTGKLGLKTMGGTITTIVTASKIVSYGFQYFLEITAYIGVNLAVFNLLPIPALDGSKVVFCLIEWIRKKPINRNVEAVIHAIGFILIIGFAILVDVLQFI